MKIRGTVNIGNVVIKVEIAVQGDAQEFDMMNMVNCGIRYPRGTELVKSLKSSRGTNADGFCLVSVILRKQ